MSHMAYGFPASMWYDLLVSRQRGGRRKEAMTITREDIAQTIEHRAALSAEVWAEVEAVKAMRFGHPPTEWTMGQLEWTLVRTGAILRGEVVPV